MAMRLVDERVEMLGLLGAIEPRSLAPRACSFATSFAADSLERKDRCKGGGLRILERKQELEAGGGVSSTIPKG